MSEEQKKQDRKVIIEVEQTDDGLHVRLEGLKAFKQLQELAEAFCSCRSGAAFCGASGGATKA
ncbi:MAG: hypothetical protein HYV63_04835 [Candidatus Schekmanbacteria bacterium]|nr:hypothetical protein [Candidatus Schekmanbacteria bacterium]